MTSNSTTPCLPQSEIEPAAHLFDNWFDPIEAALRDRTREVLQAMFEGELDGVLARLRYVRPAKLPSAGLQGAVGVTGHRHGHRSRSLLGTFGRIEIEVPRARLNTANGKTTAWKSQTLRAYQRRTLAADALIASCYLAGTNTRRVRRALGALFGGAVGKDTVSRVWRKVKTDWDAWNARSLAEEPIVRLILDGTVVRVRLDRKATSISLLVVIGVRADGQKVLLALKSSRVPPMSGVFPEDDECSFDGWSGFRADAEAIYRAWCLNTRGEPLPSLHGMRLERDVDKWTLCLVVEWGSLVFGCPEPLASFPGRPA